MKDEASKQPEYQIGAFVPVMLLGGAVVCGVLGLITSPASVRAIFGIAAVLLLSGGSAVLGAIWMSRRHGQD